jgi:hypothetical protein
MPSTRWGARRAGSGPGGGASAWAADNAVPVIDCTAGERKHLVAEEYLCTHSVGPGVFLILVARAPAMVWDVRRSADGTVIGNLARKRMYST